MSAALDTNVLLEASNKASPLHDRALEFMEELIAGPELIYLFWPVAMGYLRLATHPSIFPHPLDPKEALENLKTLMARPHFRTAGEKEDFLDSYRLATEGVVVRGNLVSDAHLVTLMRQEGVTEIWTHDSDFRKFRGIRVHDPFA